MKQIIKLLIFSFLIIFLSSFLILSIQKSDDEIIQEKLLEFGYPAKGYVIINNTIRYSDGSFVVLETPPKKYPITAIDAYYKAEDFLKKKEDEFGLAKHGYHLSVDAKDICEVEENGNYYWAFKMYFGKGSSKGDWMGYILVDRDTGYVKMKGMFGG